MWMPRRRPEQTYLSRYWNALNRGAPAEELARLAEPLDPTLIAAIDRARALHRRRRPDPAFANRLERDLMQAFATAPAGSVPLRPSRTGPTNGRLYPESERRSIFPAPEARRRWAFAQIATAVLLIVTFVAIYFAFLYDTNAPVVQPATPVPATPAATPAPEQVDVADFRGNPARTGEMPGPGIGSGPALRWQFTARDPLNNVTVVGDFVYTASNGSILYALDRDTGAERWRFDLGGQPDTNLNSVPAVADGTVFVGSANGTVYALDATIGRELWRFVTGGPVKASPLVLDGRVYIGSGDGTFFALNVADGSIIWQVTMGQVIKSSPAVADGTIFIGESTGILHALDVATGAERWNFETPQQGLRTPAVAGGVVYVGSEDGYLYAVNAENGTERWKFAAPTPGEVLNPAVSGDTVFVSLADMELYALNSGDGSERWHVDVTGFSSPTIAAGRVYMGDGAGGVQVLDAATGSMIVELPTGPVASAVTVAGDEVYVTDLDGVLSAFTEGDGLPADEVPAASPVSGTRVAEVVWQSTGDGEGLNFPADLAIDLQGRIWVADTGNNRFAIFGPDGTLVETWGSGGTGDGQFRLLRTNGDGYGAIAFAPDGGFYVLDVGNKRVQRFSADRQFVAAWGGEGQTPGTYADPIGIAVDASGTVYVLDDQRDVVERYAPDGTVLGSFDAHPAGSGGFNTANGLAIDAAGNVYVSNLVPNQIEKFDSDGTLVAVIGETGTGPGKFGDQPAAMAIDAAGRLFVTSMFDDPRVQVFDADGQFLAQFGAPGEGDGALSVPFGMVLDGQGNLYVSDAAENRLVKYRLLPPLA